MADPCPYCQSKEPPLTGQRCCAVSGTVERFPFEDEALAERIYVAAKMVQARSWFATQAEGTDLGRHIYMRGVEDVCDAIEMALGLKDASVLTLMPAWKRYTDHADKVAASWINETK